MSYSNTLERALISAKQGGAEQTFSLPRLKLRIYVSLFADNNHENYYNNDDGHDDNDGNGNVNGSDNDNGNDNNNNNATIAQLSNTTCWTILHRLATS